MASERKDAGNQSPVSDFPSGLPSSPPRSFGLGLMSLFSAPGMMPDKVTTTDQGPGNRARSASVDHTPPGSPLTSPPGSPLASSKFPRFADSHPQGAALTPSTAPTSKSGWTGIVAFLSKNRRVTNNRDLNILAPTSL